MIANKFIPKNLVDVRNFEKFTPINLPLSDGRFIHGLKE